MLRREKLQPTEMECGQASLMLSRISKKTLNFTSPESFKAQKDAYTLKNPRHPRFADRTHTWRRRLSPLSFFQRRPPSFNPPWQGSDAQPPLRLSACGFDASCGGGNERFRRTACRDTHRPGIGCRLLDHRGSCHLDAHRCESENHGHHFFETRRPWLGHGNQPSKSLRPIHRMARASRS